MFNQVNDVVDNWFLERWAKLTASENYKLLTGGKGNAMFGDGAMTYIEQKAMEMVTAMWERPELEEVKSLLHGKMYEYPAYQEYCRVTKNYSMKYLGTETPLFLEYEPLKEESGGSPDIINITSSDTIDAGAEIKCPKNPVYHFRRLSWKDQWDVKENYMLCYCQIQNLLMITDAFVWQFVSYDERQLSKSKKIKVIDVYPDKNFQSNLEVRLHMAVKEKYNILSKHLGTPLSNRTDLQKYLKQ